MSTVDQIARPLVDGERLSRDEFLRRWELLPDVKRAELIEGVVYMPSPVGLAHSDHDALAGTWLGHYAAFTPGVRPGHAGTWLMPGENAPQPDVNLRILPEYGGQSGIRGGLAEGAPELIVEVSYSSRARDLGPKLELYRSAGVVEYITVLIRRRQIVWRRLVNVAYVPIEPGTDGILCSVIFPGLWLDPQALLDLDAARVLAVVQQGVQSAEHAVFAANLSERRKS